MRAPRPPLCHGTRERERERERERGGAAAATVVDAVAAEARAEIPGLFEASVVRIAEKNLVGMAVS